MSQFDINISHLVLVIYTSMFVYFFTLGLYGLNLEEPLPRIDPIFLYFTCFISSGSILVFDFLKKYYFTSLISLLMGLSPFFISILGLELVIAILLLHAVFTYFRIAYFYDKHS